VNAEITTPAKFMRKVFKNQEGLVNMIWREELGLSEACADWKGQRRETVYEQLAHG
jgi:hypothetical protein